MIVNKEQKPITITFYKDDLPKLREVRCIKCSRILCKVNAEIKDIVFTDGFTPEEHYKFADNVRVIEHKCRGCECIYKFLLQK